MNWIKNFVRPRFPSVFREREDTPDNLWDACKKCGEMIFHKDLQVLQKVCPGCDHHMRIGAAERFEALFDKGAFELIAVPDVPHDPLKFKDQKKYAERLKDARSKTGDRDAVKVAKGTIGGQTSIIAVQDFHFMGGSLGMAAGEAVVTAGQAALENNAPLIMVAAAGGARMQEGILSLMQMPRTTVIVQQLREQGLPYIVLLTDPTTGGVTASYGMLGDVHIAEPGALIGFAGPRVIQDTIKEKLPEGFQRAEYLLEHGMVDMVVHRHKMAETLANLLDLLMGGKAPQAAE
ncbi:MAG: acetyl-CoA carboxylase carboxyltransferase subunit beta [Rhodobiaceae bacterium]|jgi:acetyl-CoA carboxylase carboxyl transferase subunit beta|nr:acetyl-CoA carboxylase carboxyltransferase subunit beta [Rhodobiaceae bacterium]MBT7279465.1 acetyl-CoA carboxylase carboxyltransferase subunit beta [Rhodobiaceae bacterium]MDG2495150.1 acetyl-CoA carboxylase, carboxyltransferase subunit beta [Alphaproteobacteria bacterium]